MDVDIVTQPLVEVDFNPVLQRVRACGVRIAEGVTDSENPSSVLHIPCCVLLIKIGPQFASEVKIPFRDVKSPADTVDQIIKVRFGTLPLEDCVR